MVLTLLAAAGLGACQKHETRTEVGAGDCYLCHVPEYEDPTNEPPHPGLFATTCADCHITDAWIPAVAINHEWFVLADRHAEIHCSECHTVGYRPGDTSSECVSCHQADYDASTMPHHASTAGGLSTDCASCHTVAVMGWPSSFVHPWALEGAHASLTCESAGCHRARANPTGDVATGPPLWTGRPTACVGCHQGDYDNKGAMDASHATYSNSCENCHTTTGWRPALGHPERLFPLSDPHNIACVDCHNEALGPPATNADCVGCHTGRHARGVVDDQHREVSGYGFDTSNPSFCLDCHPNGRR